MYASVLPLKDDDGYRLKNWNFYFQPEENGNFALGLEKKIAMKNPFGVSFQKVNYDGTQIEDILKGISLLPWLFEYYIGDEEEILKGQKYTAYYKFDFKTRKPANLLHYLFQPDTSFFLGLTYIDVSIDHYIYTANTE